MHGIFGYGEDGLTLLIMKKHLPMILEKFKDSSDSSKCIAFYRPSFGRAGGKNSSEFGEFDAIIASSKNIYLIESKWDNLSKNKNYENVVKKKIRPEQELRHKIFEWYLIHWNKTYANDWEKFIEEQESDFQDNFGKKLPRKRKNSLLPNNLEFVFEKLLSHCKDFSSKENIKNVLLFFYKDEEPDLPEKIGIFELVKINYSKDLTKNFINLD